MYKTELSEIDTRIPHETLNIIRGILVKSLSRENVSETDIRLYQHRQRAFECIGKREKNVFILKKRVGV